MYLRLADRYHARCSHTKRYAQSHASRQQLTYLCRCKHEVLIRQRIKQRAQYIQIHFGARKILHQHCESPAHGLMRVLKQTRQLHRTCYKRTISRSHCEGGTLPRASSPTEVFCGRQSAPNANSYYQLAVLFKRWIAQKCGKQLALQAAVE